MGQAALAATAQVLLLNGGTSTVAASEGAGITLFEADTTTQSSIGYAQGLHLGGSREVRSGPLSVTLGDSSLSLSLPTDVADEYRSIRVRGALLQTLRDGGETQGPVTPATGGTRSGGRFFSGWTGSAYQNAFFSSIEPSKRVALVEAHTALSPRLEFSGVALAGSRSTVLASAAWIPRASTVAAITTGWSGGHAVFRASLRDHGNSWQTGVNYTAGALELQPDPSISAFNLEHTGLNGSISKRIGNWLFLDGARYQFNTADAPDAASAGVIAARSTLYEGGGTVRTGHLEAGVRLLHSGSGPQVNSGEVFIAAWNTTRWSLRSTSVSSTSQGSSATRSTTIESSQQICQHFRLTQGGIFAGTTPDFTAGGLYENRFGSLSISHRETFVPFGIDAGFHRVLSIGIHLHLGSTDISADQVSGHGLHTMYDVAMNGFYGDSLGYRGGARDTPHAMPKYAVQGRVVSEAGEPVRGAAVRAGNLTVFTDSEGRYQAQFARSAPVQVAVAPADFLTVEAYCALTAPRTIAPAAQGKAGDLLFQVQRCHAKEEPQTGAPQTVSATDEDAGTLRHTLEAMRATARRLGRRMVHVKTVHRDAA